MSEGKQVVDGKAEEQQQAPEQAKENQIKVDPGTQGNIPVLTVQLLDAINKNLITIIQQNAKALGLAKE